MPTLTREHGISLWQWPHADRGMQQEYSKELVFEVPRGRRYVLEVSVPGRSRPVYTSAGARTFPVDFRVALPPSSQPQ